MIYPYDDGMSQKKKRKPYTRRWDSPNPPGRPRNPDRATVCTARVYVSVSEPEREADRREMRERGMSSLSQLYRMFRAEYYRSKQQ